MWANFEEAKTFFGSFPGNHKTFGPWKQSFLRKEKKIKNEAQQRLMKELGGSGKQYYTPAVEYMPPLQSFGFVSKKLDCEKCQNEFENALSVSDHIRSAHHEELRKMFAKDARENLEEDSEYQIWLEAPTEINKNDATNSRRSSFVKKARRRGKHLLRVYWLLRITSRRTGSVP